MCNELRALPSPEQVRETAPAYPKSGSSSPRSLFRSDLAPPLGSQSYWAPFLECSLQSFHLAKSCPVIRHQRWDKVDQRHELAWARPEEVEGVAELVTELRVDGGTQAAGQATAQQDSKQTDIRMVEAASWGAAGEEIR